MEAQKAYVMEVATLFPLQGDWTETDYFSLPESNRIIELSNGELIMPPGPTFGHQRAVARLHRKIMTYAEEHNVGEAIAAPFGLRLWEGKIRQPDVLLVRTAHFERVKRTYIDGPADWVAEVISPGTRKTDVVEKRAEYAQAGVPEYWLIDLDERTILIYSLPAGGSTYRLAGSYASGQVAESVALPGFKVAVDEIITAGPV